MINKTVDNSLTRKDMTDYVPSYLSSNNYLKKADSETIAGYGMPTTSVNTSFVGTAIGDYTYTAPANGWFAFAYVAGGTPNSLVITYIKETIAFTKTQPAKDLNGSVICPCKKGDKIKVSITTHALSSISWQRFIKCSGG